jgi:hypothetical protein
VIDKGMARSATRPEGVWRALQLLLSPIGSLAKVAAGTVLFLILIAGGLIWALNAWALSLTPSPRQPAKPPAEVRELMSRLASVSTFRGLTPKETCRRHRQKPVESMDSCTLDFGKTAVRVYWTRTSGHLSSVRLKTSISDEEQAAHWSAPLRWVNFAEVHRILCPQGPDAVAAMASLPQRLSQTSWSGSKRNEMRSIVVADMIDCRARLDEIRDDENNQLAVWLTYRINPF